MLSGNSVLKNERLDRRGWLAAWAVAGLAGLLRLAFINQRGFWCDEYLTLDAASKSISGLVRNRLAAGHSPLYYFYAKLPVYFGESEWILRLTSVVAVVAATLLLTGLSESLKLYRHRGPLWLLAVIHPYWISIGTQYRYMMMLVAVGIGAAWAAVAYLDRPDGRRGAVLAFAVCVLVWIHASSQFFAAALLVWLLWEAMARERDLPGRLRLRRAAILAWPVLAALATSLILLYLIREHGAYREKEFPNLNGILRNTIEVSFGDYRLWPEFFGFSYRFFLYSQLVLLVVAAFLARRELLRQGLASSWRLLLSLLIVMPGAMILASVLVRNYQGPSRYLCAFSIPTLLCFAVALGTRAAPVGRNLFRVALCGMMVVQAAATALERGDRQMEAVKWIVANHKGTDPVLVGIVRPNRLSLEYHGLRKKGVIRGMEVSRKKLQEVTQSIREEAATGGRGYFLVYYTEAPVIQALKDLIAEKFILAERHWVLSGLTLVGAYAREARELLWLQQLTPPVQAWGPTQGEPIE